MHMSQLNYLLPKFDNLRSLIVRTRRDNKSHLRKDLSGTRSTDRWFFGRVERPVIFELNQLRIFF